MFFHIHPQSPGKNQNAGLWFLREGVKGELCLKGFYPLNKMCCGSWASLSPTAQRSSFLHVTSGEVGPGFSSGKVCSHYHTSHSTNYNPSVKMRHMLIHALKISSSMQIKTRVGLCI